MKSQQVNLRLEADLISAVEQAAEEEYLDRGTMFRKLLIGALAQRRVDRALHQYQLGEISIGRAAEDARLTQWEILDLARRRGIAYQIDVEEIAERLDLRGTTPQVAESSPVYADRPGAQPPGAPRRSESSMSGRRATSGAATLPDYPPRPGGVLLVGLGPAPPSIAAGHYYQGRLGKRLWRRLAHAGLSAGAIPGSEDEAFVASGHGITDLVKRPTESAKDLQHEELRAGVQELHEKVRAWQPALILFAFKRVAEIAVDGPVSPGLGPLFEGVPTFLLSGPYASRDEADRVDAELRDVVSRALPGVYQTVVSQRVTDADLEAGIVRLPRAAKELLPVEKSDVSVVLRGTPLVAKYDPKRGGDRERSGVLRIGAPLSRLVKSGDRLRVSRGPNGRVLLD